MKKLLIAALAASVAFSMVGCKGTNEKRGDEHLKEGRFRNAINSYLEAKKKGSMSSEFYDNFTLALVRAAEIEAKKDLNSDLINGYFEKASVNMPDVKEDVVVEEYVTTLANVGKQQAAQEGVDYNTVINAFAKIDTALATAKARNVAEGAVKAIRTEAENAYVAKNLADAKSESDPVVCEYQIMKIAEMAPENSEVKAALNKSRLGTRGYFLIFGENVPDLSGKQRVDIPDMDESEFSSPEFSVEEEEVYTENMVNIYIKQGRYQQALEILRKISLNNPKKSSNFAAQIYLLEVLLKQNQ